MSGKSVFILGAGQIGRAAAGRFAEAGWEVRLAHRTGGPFPESLRVAGVTEIFVDRDLEHAVAGALGAGADALIDTIAYTAEHTSQLLAVQDRVGAYTVISSCSVYCDDDGRTLDEARETGFPRFARPIAETQPTVAAGPATYSTRKVAMEEALASISRPVSILRPGAIHGPGCNAPREWWFVKRALDRRAVVPVAYEGASHFHTTAAVNIAELCRVLLDAEIAGVFNIGDPDPPTVREIGATVGAIMNHSWDIAGLPKHPEGAIGLTPWSIPRPMLIDTAKAEAIGYRPVATYVDAVVETCRDLVQRTRDRLWREVFPGLAAYPEPWFNYAAEDAFMAR